MDRVAMMKAQGPQSRAGAGLEGESRKACLPPGNQEKQLKGSHWRSASEGDVMRTNAVLLTASLPAFPQQPDCGVFTVPGTRKHFTHFPAQPVCP